MEVELCRTFMQNGTRNNYEYIYKYLLVRARSVNICFSCYSFSLLLSAAWPGLPAARDTMKRKKKRANEVEEN